MKRLVLLLGRIGTVLLAMTLALLLVSLLPSASLGGDTEYRSTIQEGWFQPVFSRSLTPQQSVQLTVTSNSTVQLYLLEVDTFTMFSWLENNTAPGSLQFNITNLDNFLRDYGPPVALNQSVSSSFEYEYFPTTVTGVTSVVANRGPGSAFVSVTASTTSQLVPSVRVRNLAWWTFGLGAVLASPWVFSLLRARTRSSDQVSV